MQDVNKLYNNLTGVDIEQQKRLWDERGKGYYGEYLVFKQVVQSVSGNCKMLMNLNIPVSSDKTTEIDLLMIHETGFYVFEVKHYKGTIYGKYSDDNWTQYFRTTANNVFRNPIKQNAYHISALKKRFPEVPIFSYIIFTNEECEIKADGHIENVEVCKLQFLDMHLRKRCDAKPHLYSMESIDEFFKELQDFAPLNNVVTDTDGSIIPFFEYAKELNKDYLDQVTRIKNECEIQVDNANKKFSEAEKDFKKRKIKVFIFAILFFIVVALSASFFVDQVKKEYHNYAVEIKAELDAFAQKFKKVDELNNGNLVIREDLLKVTDVLIEKSNDILNAIDFSFTLTATSAEYGVYFQNDASIIVLLSNGDVQEYNVFGDNFRHNLSFKLYDSVWFIKKKEFPKYKMYDVSMEDIVHIKLIGLTLLERDGDTIQESMELKLYEQQ